MCSDMIVEVPEMMSDKVIVLLNYLMAGCFNSQIKTCFNPDIF